MSLFEQARSRLDSGSKWTKLFPIVYRNLDELVAAIVSKCRDVLEVSTDKAEIPYKKILCKNGRPKDQYDEELKRFVFVVFYESDTRIEGNAGKHEVLPTADEVLEAAAVAPNAEREIVLLVANAVVEFRTPVTRRSSLRQLAERLDTARKAAVSTAVGKANALVDERRKRFAPAISVIQLLNNPTAIPDRRKAFAPRGAAPRRPQK